MSGGDPLSRALVRRHVPAGLDPGEQRAAMGQLEGWVGLLLNVVLFGLKLALGLATGSVALVADAVHTAADSLTSGVLILGSRISRQPADAEHPYGHGRAELIAALIIAVLLGVAGIEFLEASVERIIEPEPLVAGWWIVCVVLLLAVVKEWNSRFALFLADESDSVALRADAWHHRSDVFASVLVAIGIAGTKLGVPILDGVMGAAVSLVILWSAYAVAKEAIHPLIGQAPSAREIATVAAAAQAVKGVRGVHDIVIHRYGELRLVSLHVETRHDIGAVQVHRIAARVQDAVGGGRKGHVVVHTDPVDRDSPRFLEVEGAIGRLVEVDERLVSFHDLQVDEDGSHFDLEVEVVVDHHDDDSEELRADLAHTLAGATGASAVVVHVEPAFAYGATPDPDE